jgi:two-component system OmpR family response regulator
MSSDSPSKSFANETFLENKIDLDKLKGCTVLAVDNDHSILSLLAEIFETYGLKVLTALSAISAFEIIKKIRVDILISDITMIGEDGYWLIQKIRTFTNPQVRNIPAIAFSGRAEAKIRQEALASGYHTYLQKPAGVVELLTEILELLKPSLLVNSVSKNS